MCVCVYACVCECVRAEGQRGPAGAPGAAAAGCPVVPSRAGIPFKERWEEGKGVGESGREGGKGGGEGGGEEKRAIEQLSLQGFVAAGAEPRRAARHRPAPNFAPIPGSPRPPRRSP